MLMDASFRTLQRIKIVLILGVMLAFVHDSAAKDPPGWNGITGWNGNNVAIKKVKPSDNVTQIKKDVEEKTKIPAKDQVLKFSGKVLHHGKVLHENEPISKYGVKDHDTLTMPTDVPTLVPSKPKSVKPTMAPTLNPSVEPTLAPTLGPTTMPMTRTPTATPTAAPTRAPTHMMIYVKLPDGKKVALKNVKPSDSVATIKKKVAEKAKTLAKEQNLVDTDDGPSNGALFLATLDSLLDVDESVEFAGDGDDAEDSSKFFSFVELPEGWTEGKSGRKEMCVDFNNLIMKPGYSGAKVGSKIKDIATRIFGEIKPCCHCDTENNFLENLDKFADDCGHLLDENTREDFDGVRECVRTKVKNGCENLEADNNMQDDDRFGGGSAC